MIILKTYLALSESVYVPDNIMFLYNLLNNYDYT